MVKYISITIEVQNYYIFVVPTIKKKKKKVVLNVTIVFFINYMS